MHINLHVLVMFEQVLIYISISESYGMQKQQKQRLSGKKQKSVAICEQTPFEDLNCSCPKFSSASS